MRSPRASARQRRCIEPRQRGRSFGHANGESHAGPDLTHCVIVDARAAHREIDRKIIFDLPDCTNQARAGLELADIEFIGEFAHRPHDSVVRALDNRVEKVIHVLLPGERRSGIEMHGRPAPLLRDDAGKTYAGSGLVMDSG